MTPFEMLDYTGQGVVLAFVVRWLFSLDVDLHWSACIGAVSVLLQPWLNLHFGPLTTGDAVPNMVTGAVIVLALLGIAQVIREP